MIEVKKRRGREGTPGCRLLASDPEKGLSRFPKMAVSLFRLSDPLL
jgi:hypothetical protein